MKAISKGLLAAATVIAALGLAGTAWAQDAETVIKDRQEAMKAQGKDMGAVKAFLDGKGELAAALAGGTDLATRIPQIPGLFPPKTGMAEFPGKSWAKPAIWADWDKFSAVDRTAGEKAVALLSALKGGDKDKIAAAFGDMGKNGCGACHEPFREKKPS